MGYAKVFANGKYAYDFQRYVADTIEDAKKIRMKPQNIGSEVYIISEKNDYVLGSDAKWHEKGGESSFDCDCDRNFVEESTVWATLDEPYPVSE